MSISDAKAADFYQLIGIINRINSLSNGNSEMGSFSKYNANHERVERIA